MSEKIMATWSLSLMTDCPKCDHWFDLTDIDDFWGSGRIEACEYGTKSTIDYEVTCPECANEFKVDFEY